MRFYYNIEEPLNKAEMKTLYIIKKKRETLWVHQSNTKKETIDEYKKILYKRFQTPINFYINFNEFH